MIVHLVVCALLYGLIAYLKSAAHKTFQHPLSHIPGPIAGSISELYKYFAIKSIPTRGSALHKRYGPLVRIGPNLVVFNDPKLLPYVYCREVQKTSWYTSWQWGKGIQAMFLTPNYHQYAARKRIVGPACSMTAMRRFEQRFDATVDQLCCKFEYAFASTGRCVDFAEWLRYFLADTFTYMAYGQPGRCIASGNDVNDNIESLQDTYKLCAVVALLPGLLHRVVNNKYVQDYILPYTSYGKGMKQQFELYAHQQEQKIGEHKMGFLDSISNHLSEEEARAEYITFTAATLDGVAAFISPFVDNIIQHPAVMKQITDEIQVAEKQNLLSKPVAKFDEILRLPYFQACIKKSLRRDAPAQTILPRIVGDNGIVYAYLDDSGKTQTIFIPPGTEMAASPYIIHRNVAIFGEKADEFIPERWLTSDHGGSATYGSIAQMQHYAMWWGYGDRKCAGEHYAQLEMQKLCLEMFRRFHISSAKPEQRFRHEKWAVGMFWGQWLNLEKRS